MFVHGLGPSAYGELFKRSDLGPFSSVPRGDFPRRQARLAAAAAKES